MKNREKVYRLMKKYAPHDIIENIKNIEITDDKLRLLRENMEYSVRKYGGVELSDNQEKALKMDPRFMLYMKIDEIDIEVEIEKGCTKARYALMDVNENNSTIENRNNSTRVIELKPFDIESKVADYVYYY